MEGCFYRLDRLRLKESGEWLHSDDVLFDILKPHETYFKAVPTDAGDIIFLLTLSSSSTPYIPRKEDRQDELCNFLQSG